MLNEETYTLAIRSAGEIPLEIPRMLQELKISRFKSLKNLTLKFGSANLLVGGNGAGKTNILEAIGMASACLGRGLGDSALSAKGLRVIPPNRAKSSFGNEEQPKTLKFEALFSGGVAYAATLRGADGDQLLSISSESASHEGSTIFARSETTAKSEGAGATSADMIGGHRGMWDNIRKAYDMPQQVVEAFTEFSRYAIYSPEAGILRGEREGRKDASPLGLRGEGLAGAMTGFLKRLEFLKDAAQSGEGKGSPDWTMMSECIQMAMQAGWFKGFGSHRVEKKRGRGSSNGGGGSRTVVHFIDRFLSANCGRVSARDGDEGSLFMLFAAVLLSHPDAPRIFALDCADRSLNPGLARRMARQAARTVRLASSPDASLGARQVFLVSHNPATLDAFDLFDDDQRIFLIGRNEKGHTTANRLTLGYPNREDWEKFAQGRKVSHFWLNGEIPGAAGTALLSTSRSKASGSSAPDRAGSKAAGKAKPEST